MRDLVRQRFEHRVTIGVPPSSSSGDFLSAGSGWPAVVEKIC